MEGEKKVVVVVKADEVKANMAAVRPMQYNRNMIAILFCISTISFAKLE